MKTIVKIIILLLFGLNAKSQSNPSGVPAQNSTSWYRQGWHQTDSGEIIAPRIPNFTPRFPGTTILYQQNGVDTSLYYYTGLRWIKINAQGTDTTSLSNRINLKLNISDTVAKWLGQSTRLVDTMYRVNDSTVGYTIKGNPYTFQILGRSSGGGGGSGTVTSVGLSMPSAFSVTPLSITTSGTFAVSGAGTSLQYIRGNGTLATFDTTAIPNFYLKVRGLLSGTSPITFNQTTGAIGINNANTTGTKGAASFTSAFSDNGSGLIDMADLVSSGSCTGCELTIDSKGRITAFTTGAGGATNNINIGAGFRPVNAITQEMRTYFAGFGMRLDSVANANGLTWSADTTRGSGLPTYFYVDSLSTPVTASNGLTKTGNNIKLGGSLVNNTTITSAVAANRITYTGVSTFAEGAQLDVITSGSVGTAVRGESGDGLGVVGVATTGVGVQGTATGVAGVGVIGSSIEASGLYGQSTNGLALETVVIPASTNTVIPAATFTRSSQTVGATGIGGYLDFNIRTTTGVDQESNRLVFKLTDATNASRTSSFEFWNLNNATLARKASLAGTGQWTWDGYPSLTAQIDTTTYKPVAIDASGNVVKMAGWAGSGGGGGSFSTNNIGTGYGWVATPSGNIKRAANSNTVKWDSTSTANSLTARADTSYIATKFDLQADTLVWYRRGTVLDSAGAADEGNLQEPSVLREANPVILSADTVFKMWYTAGWSNPNICYAESLDGYNWVRYSGNPVVSDHSRSSILKDGSTYVLYTTGHLGGTLDRYTSSNGVTFTLANAGIITPGAPGSWNSSGVYNSWVIKDGSTYRMLIDGLGPQGYYDGYYTSSDGITWTEYGSNPVTDLTGPYFTKIGSTYWAWGHASPTKTFTPTDGYRAYSTDMIHWKHDPIPYNSTFHRMTFDEGVDSIFGQVADFNLLQVGDSTYLYYSASQNGNNASGNLHLKLAVAYRKMDKLITTRENAPLFNSFETNGRDLIYDIGNVAVNKRLLVGNLVDAGTGDTLQVTGNTRLFGNLNVSGVINSVKLWTGNGTGTDNVSVASINSLNLNTTGSSNTVLGTGAATSNTSGSQNTAIGHNTIAANTTGGFNTIVGSNALEANTSGNFNTAIGNISMNSNETGANNTAVGRASLFGSTGDGNSVLGGNSGRAITSGSNNISLGFNSLYTDGTTASTNVTGSAAIGYNAQVTQNSSGVLGGLDANGFGMRWGIGVTAPGAWLHLPAGKTSAGFAPLIFTNGEPTTTPAAGQFMYKNGLYIIDSSSSKRDTIATRSWVVNNISGGSATTIYNGDGTLSGNRTVTGSSNNLTFTGVGNYKIFSSLLFQGKSNGTKVYNSAVGVSGGASSNSWSFAYAANDASGGFARGVGLFVDTLNNVGLGDNTLTTMPLYTTGNSVYINGLQSSKGNFYAVNTVTGNTTLGLTNYFVVVDATSGNVTITLPAASTAFGASMGIQYVFKRIDNTGNSVTISRAGSDTIDGGTSTTLTTQYQVKEIQCASSSTWLIK